MYWIPERKLISIHALLAESDGIQLLPCDMRMLFLSTLSLRRATAVDSKVDATQIISIHALLAESDAKFEGINFWQSIISIHALLAESDPQGCFLVILII